MKVLMVLQLVFSYKALGMILLTFVLSACSVAPWERGNLAKQNMLIIPNTTHSALRAHVFESKEASSGGLGGAGGGCGCN